MLPRVLAYQANRSFPDFRGLSRRCLHRSILSRNGASEKGGAVQTDNGVSTGNIRTRIAQDVA